MLGLALAIIVPQKVALDGGIGIGTPPEGARLQEDGFARLLEAGAERLLEG